MDKIAENLPDVFFDWYARLLPGCVGICTYLLGIEYFKQIPPISNVISLMVLGYLIGHCLQPFSGYFVKKMEEKYNHEKIYSVAKAHKEVKSESTAKVSKAHAEANSMFSCMVITLPNIIYFSIIHNWILSFLLLTLAIYFFFMTKERVFARDKKILKLQDEMDSEGKGIIK